MVINMIGKSFDSDSGQGIYRFSGELYNELNKEYIVFTNDNKNLKDVTIVMQPEQIWRALFKKNVITYVPDMIPIVYGERKLLYRVYFYLSMLMTAIKSKTIIAISESTKNDIIKHFKVKHKTVVNHLWASDKLEDFKLKNRFNNLRIGYLGGLGLRKNVEYILKLSQLMPENTFVIAGTGPMEKILKGINIGKNVKFLGHVPDDKLCLFYNTIDLFIFPSHYEGFGLPVVESMKCGTPPLVFDNSSLKELVPNNKYILNNDINKTVHMIKNLDLETMNMECTEYVKQFSINNHIVRLNKIIDKYIKNGYIL